MIFLGAGVGGVGSVRFTGGVGGSGGEAVAAHLCRGFKAFPFYREISIRYVGH